MLESRTIKDDHPDYPHDAVHVYPHNPHMDNQNKSKLQELGPEEQHVVIRAIDNGQAYANAKIKPSDNKADTGNCILLSVPR